jgi:hypothetical protein
LTDAYLAFQPIFSQRAAALASTSQIDLNIELISASYYLHSTSIPSLEAYFFEKFNQVKFDQIF